MTLHKLFIAALRMLLVLSLLCGVVYPTAVTVLAHLFFPQQAGGSLLVSQGRITASRLLAYGNAGAGYFHFRPSACRWNTLPASASNLALSSVAWRDSLAVRHDRFISENGLAASAKVPVEMLCASGSGLDPHITPAAAHLQVARIIANRGKAKPEEVRLHALIDRSARRSWRTLWSAPRVNVCNLNYILDNTPEFSTLKQEQP
ncbi:MAG TPA: potassium-transporting ATPase subunit C [bacterium]|nr:MAG: Potassium-transporting ATPase C chain [bacterium ADurb.Bin478]HOC89060.1 potassium-transporting ATPase subunit C [bacterium]